MSETLTATTSTPGPEVRTTPATGAPASTPTALGGAKAAAPATPAPAPDPLTGTDEGWKSRIPEELRNKPTFKNLKSEEDAYRMLDHTQSALGAEKIIKPNKHSTDEDWGKIYDALGRPATADKYDLKLPAGVTKDNPLVKAFLDEAHKSGILPKQAQAILDWNNNQAQATKAEQTKAAELAQAEALKPLKQEYGGAYESKLNGAAKALESVLGAEDAAKIIDNPAIANDPNFIRFAVKLSEMIQEDAPVGEDGKPVGLLTPKEAQYKANQIMTDMRHPYNDAGHPNHKAAVAEVSALFEAMVEQ